MTERADGQSKRTAQSELARKAALFREGTKRLYEQQGDRADMWFFDLWHFLGDVETALQSAGLCDIDITNHHNALKCPYCNPRGLKFADPHIPVACADQWQDIATAPRSRNAGHVRLFGDGEAIYQCEYIGIWSPGEDCWREAYSKRHVQPTHWMPCSPPPSSHTPAATDIGGER